jgi:hypothetical protein
VAPDASRPPGLDDRFMSFRRSDLGVSFEPGSEPIAGEVRLADGSTTTFRGYVQLIAAVEQAHRLSSSDQASRERVGELGEG